MSYQGIPIEGSTHVTGLNGKAAKGDLTLKPKASATAPGKVQIGGLKFESAQTIDMNDAAVTLTRDTDAVPGTLLTGNLLFIEANSAGGSEDLLLPPEADCNGLMLFIWNVGSDAIAVKDDAGGDLPLGALSIAAQEMAFLACTGTFWFGNNLL